MRCDHILFPIDDSEHCRALARQVEWLANLFGSHVTLLHSADIPSTCYAATESYYDSDSFNMLSERTRQRVAEFPIDLPPSRVKRAVMDGDPAREIVDWTRRHETDLIIMGTHSCGTLRGFLLGSVAEKVIHEVDCPVWVRSVTQPPSNLEKTGVRNIICALELSDEAVPLLRFTKEFASRTGASVEVVHSIPALASPPETYPNPQYEYIMQSTKSEICSVQQAAGTGFPLHLSGDGIARSILGAAQSFHADLAIIGRGRCQRTLGRLRTHVFEIIRQTSCPVLTYSCPALENSAEPLLSHARQTNGNG